VIGILAVGVTAGLLIAGVVGARDWRRRRGCQHPAETGPAMDRKAKESWRMPPLAMLAPVQMSAGRRAAMLAMYGYLGLAFVLVIVRVAQLATGH
jgi:hypothetical protein